MNTNEGKYNDREDFLYEKIVKRNCVRKMMGQANTSGEHRLHDSVRENDQWKDNQY